MFRRDVCRYADRLVHADIEIDRTRVGRLEGKFLHYSIWSYEQFLTKYDRYTTWGAKTLQRQGKRATFGSLFFRPMLRFVSLFFLRGGFLDGLPGLQACMLTAYYNTFLKQGKLWELTSVTLEEDWSNPTATEEEFNLADTPGERSSQHRAA